MVSREADPLRRAGGARRGLGRVRGERHERQRRLKAGWAQGGSVLSAAISIGFFAALRPEVPCAPLAANICRRWRRGRGVRATMAAGAHRPIRRALHMLGLRYGVLHPHDLGRQRRVPRRVYGGASPQTLPRRRPAPPRTAAVAAETIRSMFVDATRAGGEQITTLRCSAPRPPPPRRRLRRRPLRAARRDPRCAGGCGRAATSRRRRCGSTPRCVGGAALDTAFASVYPPRVAPPSRPARCPRVLSRTAESRSSTSSSPPALGHRRRTTSP